jgi:hypothetical protein
MFFRRSLREILHDNEMQQSVHFRLQSRTLSMLQESGILRL